MVKPAGIFSMISLFSYFKNLIKKEKYDVIVATTDPLIGISSYCYSKKFQIPFMYELQDNFDERVEQLRDYKFPIHYSIIFGSDDQHFPDIFVDTAERVNKLGVTVLPHIATPRAGTIWNSQLEREGRIHDRTYSHRNHRFHVVHTPRNMTPEQTMAGFVYFYQQVFSPSKVAARTYANFRDCDIRYGLGLMAGEIDGLLSGNKLTKMYGDLAHRHF